MGDDKQTTTIDFSKYQQPPAGADIDFSKYIGGTDSDDHDAIVKKYGLPSGTDLTKPYAQQAGGLKIEPFAFSKAYSEANPDKVEAPPQGFLGNAWQEVKDAAKGMFSEGTGVASAPPVPGAGTYNLIKQRYNQAASGDIAGAAGRTAADIGMAAIPFAVQGAGSLWSKFSPAASIEEALAGKITPAEADIPRPGGQIQPALNNTPREVLQHASDEGIKLTPGQATESGLAQQLQKAGTSAAIGGKELAAALLENKMKFGEAVNGFMDDVDPKRMGLSTESAGEAIKQTGQIAKQVSHENASEGYKQIDYLMDRPINPGPISAAWNKLKTALPMGAEDGILAQTPRSMRAVVQDLLSGNPEGFKPTFAQGIELRKFFREFGETEGLPSREQGIFRQMSQTTDGAMESSAASPNDIENWRAANAGWKDYATKYGDPQSVLYKILRQNDPVKTVTMLENAPATDIETLKNEHMDAALEPLRRQVLQDIAKSRFNVGHDGLGGYSDAYLKSLFSADQVKELYLKGDLANRLKYDPNPSGTAGGIQSIEQLTLGKQSKMSLAAKLSMPRDPLSFLPDVESAPSRAALPTPINVSQLPKAVNQ